MSDSVWPHRQQPIRLHCPWDSPGKNTGVGCHFLLQCMKVNSESEVTQSCLTLSNHMDCSLPGSSIHGICQARVLEWVATAFSPEMLVPFKSTLHHLNSFQFLNRKTLLHTCIIGCLASLHSICKDSFDSKCFHISKYLYVKEPSELPKNSLQDVMQTVKDWSTLG